LDYAGAPHQLVNIAGTRLTLLGPNDTYEAILMSELPKLVELDDSVQPGEPIKALARAAELEALPKAVRERAELLEAHIHELETGFKAGFQGSDDEEPNPLYGPGIPMAEREKTKVAELKNLGIPLEAWKLRRLRTAYHAEGLRALYDGRMTKIVNPRREKYPLLIEAIEAQAKAEEQESSGTAERFKRRLERRLVVMVADANKDRKPGQPEVKMPKLPSDATLARLKTEFAPRSYVGASAKTRQSNARRPDDVFTPKITTRPGEIVEIDSTPLDVLVLDDRGNPVGVDLTGAIDATSKSLVAWRFAPDNITDRVDAALLLAQMLVPEPMRPNWKSALSARYMLVNFDRKMSLDERYEGAAARPVIFPETIQVDRGKVFLSRHFGEACARFGISVMPARPGTGSDKPFAERSFNSIKTLFSQYLAGYTGADTTQRGYKVKPMFTMSQLKELFDEFVIIGWQNRVYTGLTLPHFPGRELTPNQAYGYAVSNAGYVQCPVGTDVYVNLLPVAMRVINRNGITIDRMRFTSPSVRKFLTTRSPVARRDNEWPIHYDPHDMSQVYVQYPEDGSWWAIPYAYQSIVGVPFADFMYRAAVDAVRTAGGDPTHEKEVALALKDLLDRCDVGGADGRRARRSVIRAVQAKEDRRDFDPKTVGPGADVEPQLERRWEEHRVPPLDTDPSAVVEDHPEDEDGDQEDFEPAEVGRGRRSLGDALDDGGGLL